jgi:predicted metal-binding membrane protein
MVGVTALAWAYVVQMGHSTTARVGGHLVMSCCGVNLPLTFLMWTVMMVGMMTPSAAPMILTFATVNRRRAMHSGPFVPTSIFLSGYLASWTVFSAVAAVAQWGLFHAQILDPHRQAVTPAFGGALLIAAGIFQLTPAKNACLTRCRSPLDFLTTDWREGSLGAFVMGLRHGVFCIGCCWILMALLFVVGVMNLVWVAAISAFVLAEKVAPFRRAVVVAGAASSFVGGTGLIIAVLIAR